MKTRIITLIAALAGLLASAMSDVPTSVNYQGIVQVDGNDFTGTGEFKFALVTGSPRGITVTRWSHDGSSLFGNEPSSSIRLPVSGGLFTIGLGDTSVSNMSEPIDPADIDAEGVLLRVWFSDGENGFSVLSPDRPLRSVPYALQAASLVGGVGTIDGSQIIDDSVGAAQLADSLSATDLDLGSLNADGSLRLLGRQIGGIAEPGEEYERVKVYADAPSSFLGQPTFGGGIDLFDQSETRRVALRANGASISLADTDGDAQVVAGGTGKLIATGELGVSDSVSDLLLKSSLTKLSGGGLLRLRDVSGDITAELQAITNGSAGGRLQLREADGTLTVRMGAEGAGGGGFLSLRDGDGNVVIELDASEGGSGVTRTQVLEITGGSDLSEKFDITSAGQNDTPPAPGALVCIDPDRPGALVASSRAYDRTVAGVISGAGGINPGMLMGQRGSIADGGRPVALTGRVYCLVDAGFGAIEPGDLITTSDTPGYGMRVDDHELARGAVIGKAMTRLESGRGLVLVLVSLQ